MHSEMTIDVEAVRHLLDVNGLRFTLQRYSLVAFLMENAGHPTAVEIFEGVNRLDPRSSKATVYRNLRDLVEAGLVREVAVEGRSARFDLKGIQHHHFICDRCGTVENMDWFDVLMPPSQRTGKRVVREYELILRGLCDACASAPRDNPGANTPDENTDHSEPQPTT
jgi:Fur family peroxide stress response transcriptional regulator